MIVRLTLNGVLISKSEIYLVTAFSRYITKREAKVQQVKVYSAIVMVLYIMNFTTLKNPGGPLPDFLLSNVITVFGCKRCYKTNPKIFNQIPVESIYCIRK